MNSCKIQGSNIIIIHIYSHNFMTKHLEDFFFKVKSIVDITSSQLNILQTFVNDCHFNWTLITVSTFVLQTGQARHTGAQSEQHTRCVQGKNMLDTYADWQILQITWSLSFKFSSCKFTNSPVESNKLLNTIGQKKENCKQMIISHNI